MYYRKGSRRNTLFDTLLINISRIALFMISKLNLERINLLLSEFKSKLNLRFIIGAEIEFYLDNLTEDKFNLFVRESSEIKFEKEKGKNQFEVQIDHSDDIESIITLISNMRSQIIRRAKKYGMEAIFAAKPFDHEPGNALHFHISLYDDKENVFANKNGNESQYLLHAIGGLCELMKEKMIYFIPNKEGYKRLVPKFNAPTTVSWGGNNRTVAIRIPTTGEARRIEHRVASADADPALVLEAIIEGIHYGIFNKIHPPEKIYGDASDVQYKLEKLPQTYEEALLEKK